MRVGVGGFYHETNTFSAASTGLDQFRAYQFAAGDAIARRFAGTNSEIGGMVDRLAADGHDIVPLVFAAAVPSGPIEPAALEAINGDLCDRLRGAGALDAVLLSLHGAAAATGEPDADGAVVAAVRAVVGRDVRIGVSLDYHANVSARLLEGADFVSVYRTYPHTDMAARGAEVAARTTAASLPPARAVRKLPLVTVPLAQATGDAPMRGIMDLLDRERDRPGISSNSLAMGFAYADSPQLGATVLVWGDNDAACAASADRIAGALWAAREHFEPALVGLDDLPTEIASGAQGGPLVLVDPADNIGGGSAGDGTAILEVLLATGASGTIQLTDPEAVRIAEKAGVGGRFDAPVGARTDALHGGPVRLAGTVERLGEAQFRHTGSYMTGFVTSMGPTATVQAGGLRVVLTSRRTMPFDPGVLTAVGIDPAAEPLIVVKAAIAWRAAFGDIAGRVVVVDTPGICPASLAQLAYRRLDRPVWPIDRSARFTVAIPGAADPGGG